MSAGTNASIILGLLLLALMLFLGGLMFDFQRKLNRLDREALEARGASPAVHTPQLVLMATPGVQPGHCAYCGQPLPRNWRFWTSVYVCTPTCTTLPSSMGRRRAQEANEDKTKGSHFREMIYEVPADA